MRTLSLTDPSQDTETLTGPSVLMNLRFTSAPDFTSTSPEIRMPSVMNSTPLSMDTVIASAGIAFACISPECHAETQAS